MKVKDVTRGWGANPTAGQMRNLLALLWIKMVVGVLVLHVGFVMVGMLKHGGASSTPYNTLTVIRIGTTAVGVVGVFFGLMLRAPNPRCCPPEDPARRPLLQLRSGKRLANSRLNEKAVVLTCNPP